MWGGGGVLIIIVVLCQGNWAKLRLGSSAVFFTKTALLESVEGLRPLTLVDVLYA